LGGNSVIQLFEDNESDIWVDLHEGAPFFFSERPSAFENFTHQRGQLRRSLVTSIYEDRRKVLWIGSTGALNRIDRANGTNTVPPGVGTKGEVLSIIEDRSGALVAGTFWQGLQRLNPATGQTEPYLRSRGALSNQSEHPIMRLFIDHQGTLWAATLGGLRRLDPATGQFTTYKPDPQDTVEYSDIKEDSNGKLWLGGESGLQRFDPTTGQFTIYKDDPDNPKSVSDHRINSVFFDRSGGMWLGTQDGFDRFDPRSGSAKAYYEKDGLAGNVASCILEDERGTLWIGTNNGLSNFDSLTEKFKNFSAADGLPGPDLTGWSTCFRSPRGEMFFGGFSGATAFYPGRIRDSSYLPNTVLTDFRLSGVPVGIGSSSPLNRSITYTDSITLSRRQNNFAIEFSALSYFNAATNRYRYKLEGLDNQWHEVGSDQRLASYTTLPWGRYTFRVQGATSRGAWSEPGAALSIEILPPWWGTWWFRVSCVGGFVLLLWALYQLRLQQLQRQLDMTLEVRVGERIRIARELHDTLLQSFQGLMFRFQAARNMLPGRPEQAMQALDGAIARTEQAITESRGAIGDLRSEPVAQGDLAELLTAMGQELAAFEDTNRDGPVFRVIVEGERRRLSPILQEEVCWIARELLRNAFQHAHAHQIEAEIRYEDHLFRLRVRDDGKGMDPKVLEFGGRAGHWGLPGVRERAQKLGVRLDFWSEAGAGTEVQLTIPAAVAYEKSRYGAGFRLFRKARIHEHQS
jgi:signal transduction histidine kinase/streptogramin lyase